MPEATGATEAADETQRLVGLIQTQQESIDYLVQYIERVETHLNDRMDTFEARPAAPPPPLPPPFGGKPKPIRWETLTGEQRRAAWLELDEFVTELVERHGMQQYIRPCWWRHGFAVEELTALYSARLVAFANDSDASMPSWWQDLLERIQKRLKLTFGKCRDGHAELELRAWRSEEDRSRFLRMVEEESAEPQRDQSPPPVPPARPS
ncbi:hypothetical protein ACIHCQ_20235 [Streptomyces sp. NPDC052236]|uniref:hypothetical protein n=1 Tax=Streptomyces sp. NPDC052236 TaxID=3365686 RepID=UPI0037D38441